MNNLLGVVLCIIAPIFVLYCGDTQAGPRFIRYTSEAGLCNDYIRCICRDRHGFLWIGTFDGLSVFDGLKFHNYKRDFGNPNSLPSNTILDIKEDSAGRLWIATAKGICLYDRAQDHMRRVRLAGADSQYHPMSFYFDRQDHLWMASQLAVASFRIDKDGNGTLLRRYPFPAEILSLNYRRSIYTDRKQRKWVIAGFRLFRVDEQRGQLAGYVFENERHQLLSVSGMAEDKEGGYWLTGAEVAGIFRFRPDADTQVIRELYTPPPAMCGAGARFLSLCYPGIGADSNGLMIGSQSNGLLLFDVWGKHFSQLQYNPDNKFSLSNNQVHTVCHDQEGMLWLGTAYGLNLYDPLQQQQQTTFPDETTREDMFTDILPVPQEKTLWIGTAESGVYQYEEAGGPLRSFPLPGVQSRVQYLYRQRNGTLWIGCEDGLYMLPRGSSRIRRAPFKSAAPVSISYISALTEDSLLITSFENGCWRYSCRTAGAVQLTTADGLYSNRCTYVSENGKGQLFITHIANGISIMDIKTGRIRAIPLQPFIEKELDYPATFTYCSYPENDSILWIGTGLGLVRYNYLHNAGALIPATAKLKTDSEIWTVIPGEKPYLWLKTTFGVYKFSTESYAVAEFHPLGRKNIKAQDGYFRMRRWAGDMLIIPAYHSFHALAAAKPAAAGRPGRVVLTYVKVEDKSRPVSADEKNISIQLAPGESSLELQFVAPGFHHPEYTVYAYRFNDEAWRRLPGNFLSFQNLKAGKYRLEIKANNYDDIDTEALQLSIDVHPYLWQTPWFYLALTVMIAAGLYGLYRYRMQQLMALQQVRQKISKDLHDDIGATVSSIGILAGMAKHQELAPAKQLQFLNTISEESRYVAQALSDIVWTINPGNDRIQLIFARLLRYATELFDARNIAYDIRIPEEELKNLSLGMESRQHLYLIFKEAVNNLVKYADATAVHMEVRIKNHQLTVLISDNGKGFDMSRPSHGNGIANMSKRALEVKGKLEIISAEGKGTTVILQMPV